MDICGLRTTIYANRCNQKHRCSNYSTCHMSYICHTFVIHLSYICHTFVIHLSYSFFEFHWHLCWTNIGYVGYVGIMLLIMLDAMRHIHRTLPGQGDEAGADLGTIRNGADSQQTQDINEAIRRNTKNRMKYNEYTVYDIMIYYIWLYMI